MVEFQIKQGRYIDDYKSIRYITSQMIDLKYKNLTLRTNTNYLLMA